VNDEWERTRGSRIGTNHGLEGVERPDRHGRGRGKDVGRLTHQPGGCSGSGGGELSAEADKGRQVVSNRD